MGQPVALSLRPRRFIKYKIIYIYICENIFLIIKCMLYFFKILYTVNISYSILKKKRDDSPPSPSIALRIRFTSSVYGTI